MATERLIPFNEFEKQLRVKRLDQLIYAVREWQYGFTRNNDTQVETNCFCCTVTDLSQSSNAKNKLTLNRSNITVNLCDACYSIIYYKANNKKEPIRFDSKGLEHYFLIKECGTMKLFQNSSEYELDGSEFILEAVCNDTTLFLDNDQLQNLREVLKEDFF